MKKVIIPISLVISLLLGSATSFGYNDLSNNPFLHPVSDTVICTMNYVYGLSIRLQDKNGNVVKNAKIKFLKGKNGKSSANFSNGEYVGLGEGSGSYTYEISARGYKTIKDKIYLEHGRCHVVPLSKTYIMKKTNSR